MKISGDYIMREIVGEYVLVPVGDTALQFSGMISLNETGALIWKNLSEGKSREEILAAMLDEFEVTPEEADADLDDFFDLLKKNHLVEE